MYACEKCGYRSGDRKNIRLHVRNVHNIKNSSKAFENQVHNRFRKNSVTNAYSSV